MMLRLIYCRIFFNKNCTFDQIRSKPKNACNKHQEYQERDLKASPVWRTQTAIGLHAKNQLPTTMLSYQTV